MNLLYSLTAYPPYIGGAQLHQHLIAQQLHTHHAVQVVSFWDANRTDWLLGTTIKAPAVSKDYVVDGISVHRLGFGWGDKLKMLPWVPIYYPLMSAALPAIAQVIAKQLQPYAHQADLVHNVRIGREGLTYASLQVARQRDIPFVLTPVHHPRWTGWRYRAYDQLYRQADAVIALTETERQILSDIGVQRDRIHITGHGPVLAPHADGNRFRQTFEIDAPFILFLGQHYRYKGFRQVLEAAPLVWQTFPDVHFMFVGPAKGDSEKVFAANSDPRIHRLGAVDLQTKTDALAACTLLCVPSLQESFGGVFTEAWSFQKPVIGGRIPAVADVVSDQQDGLLVNQIAPEIAQAICDLLQHPEMAAKFGRTGYQKVKENYSWSRLAQKTLQVYQQIT